MSCSTLTGHVVIDWYFEGKVVAQETVDASQFSLEEDGMRGSDGNRFLREMYIAFVSYDHEYDDDGDVKYVELEGKVFLETDCYENYCELARFANNPHAEGECEVVENYLSVS